jgi:hypothetical protein
MVMELSPIFPRNLKDGLAALSVIAALTSDLGSPDQLGGAAISYFGGC